MAELSATGGGSGGDLPVSVVIPVRNEERNLPGCLERLSRFAEIVVVDSGSDDRTIEIAEGAGARVIQFSWDGKFPKKRNYVLMNETLKAPWVLFLDADEYISETFCDELARVLKDTSDVGYWLNYTNYFNGQELKHGVPQRKLALFRVGAGLYERIEEDNWSSLDMEVHEHPVLDGTIGEISATIDHRDFRGLPKFVARHLDYALWEARRHALLYKDGKLDEEHLSDRQKFKYSHIAKWWYAPFYFAYTYFVKLGFLDGGPGLTYAFQKMWYFATIRSLILENRREAATAG